MGLAAGGGKLLLVALDRVPLDAHHEVISEISALNSPLEQIYLDLVATGNGGTA